MIQRTKNYLRSLFHYDMPERTVLQQVYNEISQSLASAYMHPQTKNYLQSLTVKSLLNKSVQYYVGSRNCPRNETIVKILLNHSKSIAEKSRNQEDMNLVEYHEAYYTKMDSMKNSNTMLFELASDKFMDLSEKGNCISSYLVGKQLFMLMQNGSLDKNKHKGVVQNCLDLFSKSICQQQYGGLYYIAQISRNYLKKGIKDDDIFELMNWAVSLGNPIAHFKIALIYKERGEYDLYKSYLLEAAEMGVLQAQHNLGVDYMRGQVFPKNDIKAFGWFMNASAHGFIFSKYNAAKILEKGSECKKLKPNPKAAIVLLQQINRQGQLDVQKQLEGLVRQVEAQDDKSDK